MNFAIFWVIVVLSLLKNISLALNIIVILWFEIKTNDAKIYSSITFFVFVIDYR
jgi:hypothetical protein